MIAAKYLLTSEIEIDPENIENCLKLWKQFSTGQFKLYVEKDGNSLLEMKALSNLENLQKELDKSSLKKELAPFATSDFRQELLEYQESVVNQNSILPEGSYLQLRHIEVPLNIHQEYLSWRGKTIFPHVRSLNNIDSFIAYHSLFSSTPGVMFVSSFSCDPEEYQAGFSNERYQEIVKQAGQRFIAGGTKGLYTKIYRHQGK